MSNERNAGESMSGDPKREALMREVLRRHGMTDDLGALISQRDVLWEAVQAARDYFAQSLPYVDDPDAALAQEKLRGLLRRFTFKGYA